MTRQDSHIKEKSGFFYKIPFEGASITINDGLISAKGPNGESCKELKDKRIKVEMSDNYIIISSKKSNKNVKKMINTFRAHIKNIIQGVNKSFVYELKICSGHFPMKVTMDKNMLSIHNFLGEKVPRVLQIDPKVKVSIEGEIIKVESSNKESAGQAAGSIEQLTRRAGYDTRIFQDGCYIIKKAGKDLK